MALSTRQRDLSPLFDGLADESGGKASGGSSTGGTSDGTRVIGMGGDDSSDDMSGRAPSMISAQTAVQTIQQAMQTKYYKINYWFCIIFNIGLNLGMGYGFRGDVDLQGLWAAPTADARVSTSLIWSDLLLTVFCVAFFTCLLVTPGVRAEVTKGQLAPTAAVQLLHRPYSFTPIRIENVWLRSLALAAQAQLMCYLPALALLSIICQAGGMSGSLAAGSTLLIDNGSIDVCRFDYVSYIWFKAIFTGIVAATVYPLIFAGALNVAYFPPELYDLYVEKKQAEMQQMAAASGAAGVYAPPRAASGSMSSVSSVHSAASSSSSLSLH